MNMVPPLPARTPHTLDGTDAKDFNADRFGSAAMTADARTKAEVESLVCLHSPMFSREAIGFTALTEEEIASFKPVLSASRGSIR
jgi:hypothetical protein